MSKIGFNPITDTIFVLLLHAVVIVSETSLVIEVESVEAHNAGSSCKKVPVFVLHVWQYHY